MTISLSIVTCLPRLCQRCTNSVPKTVKRQSKQQKWALVYQSSQVYTESAEYTKPHIAILNCASFQFMPRYEHNSWMFLKQALFLSEHCTVSIVITSVWSSVFRPWHRPTIVLLLVYCPVDNTLFEGSPEIRCSGVSSRHCCYGNHAVGSKPILKLFYHINWELKWDLSLPKIIR